MSEFEDLVDAHYQAPYRFTMSLTRDAAMIGALALIQPPADLRGRILAAMDRREDVSGNLPQRDRSAQARLTVLSTGKSAGAFLIGT
jgi:hypothetical protein